MDKRQLLPPPYDAPAYPGQQRSRRLFIRTLMPVRSLLTLVLIFLILCVCCKISFFDQSGIDGAVASTPRLLQFQEAVAQCRARDAFPSRPEAGKRDANPRWNPTTGQNRTVILRNARLFDGVKWLPDNVDIVLAKGLITGISNVEDKVAASDATEYDMHGRYVTPGLVDMHSHHLVELWPLTESTNDGNEMHKTTQEITSMLRIIDSLKAYDKAAEMICSGGVTSSLLIPGSANIIGGEGTAVKNALFSGEHGEPVVEEMLLEHGVPDAERRRYMKMAFGENPKTVWGHTRMGVSWYLRKHLEKARIIKEKQDAYCSELDAASSGWNDQRQASWIYRNGQFPLDLELESTIALLRGRVILQNHNYEPQDMEAMLRISKEFGFRVWGFHHATEAWQVRHMLKENGNNITAAIFAEFSGYKWEAYSPNLYAGYLLDKAGVPVAYKSDHSIDSTNAKYLLDQAAVAHSFLLPEEKALQAVTSIPARAIDLDFRIGYARPGYDADIAVWNDHPLSLGATPLQVFIDGRPQLDQDKVKESTGETFTSKHLVMVGDAPRVRYEADTADRESICSRASKKDRIFVIKGIKKAFVSNHPHQAADVAKLPAGTTIQLVIAGGSIVCLDSDESCDQKVESMLKTETPGEIVKIQLNDGHVTPGLTALSAGLGIREIATLDDTGDGEPKNQKLDDPESVAFAKYGIWLDGKQFARARLGGVTRAVTPPTAASSGFVNGVSVEIGTSGKRGLSSGGIIKGEVALHLTLGEETKSSEGSVSNGIKNLRKMLKDAKAKFNGTVYEGVAEGKTPLLVYCNNKVSHKAGIPGNPWMGRSANSSSTTWNNSSW
jgi:imidazolonepropionase-like amidohydrolase